MSLFGSKEEEELELRDEIKVREVLGEQLGNLMIENGYGSLDEIREASDEEIEDIAGIGTFTLRERIRKPIAEVEPGVSEEEATPAPEVKPVSENAEAAEEEIAEISSAEEAADVDMAPPGAARIRSLFPAAVTVKGDKTPSGRTYLWPHAGSEVNVVAEDVESVMKLNRNAGRACCGGTRGHQYLELA